MRGELRTFFVNGLTCLTGFRIYQCFLVIDLPRLHTISKFEEKLGSHLFSVILIHALSGFL